MHTECMKSDIDLWREYINYGMQGNLRLEVSKLEDSISWVGSYDRLNIDCRYPRILSLSLEGEVHANAIFTECFPFAVGGGDREREREREREKPRELNVCSQTFNPSVGRWSGNPIKFPRPWKKNADKCHVRAVSEKTYKWRSTRASDISEKNVMVIIGRNVGHAGGSSRSPTEKTESAEQWRTLFRGWFMRKSQILFLLPTFSILSLMQVASFVSSFIPPSMHLLVREPRVNARL